MVVHWLSVTEDKKMPGFTRANIEELLEHLVRTGGISHLHHLNFLGLTRRRHFSIPYLEQKMGVTYYHIFSINHCLLVRCHHQLPYPTQAIESHCHDGRNQPLLKCILNTQRYSTYQPSQNFITYGEFNVSFRATGCYSLQTLHEQLDSFRLTIIRLIIKL